MCTALGDKEVLVSYLRRLRRRSDSPDDFRGVPYSRSTNAHPALPPESRSQRLVTQLAEYLSGFQPKPQAAEAVYPMLPRRRSRFYTFSPAKHERSEFNRRVFGPSLTGLTARAPAKVRFCLQRKARREVLFALRRAGFRGSTGRTKYVRRESSNWRC